MTIAEQIYALVKTLPPAQASEVLTFAEFVSARQIDPADGAAASSQAPWAEFVSSLAGAWANDFPDLDGIRAGMGADVLRESL
jgi:hypothetical protein